MIMHILHTNLDSIQLIGERLSPALDAAETDEFSSLSVRRRRRLRGARR
jgi:hypothetical protein